MQLIPLLALILFFEFSQDSDDFVYEELIELKSSDSLQDRNEFYDSISKLASEMGIKISREVIVLRVVITVERGKSMFQLHASCQRSWLLLEEM